MQHKIPSIPLGGHRGFGCTDHAFFAFRDTSKIPVENTRASIVMAFDHGADYIETDFVYSRDGTAFLLHNVVPSDHFFSAKKPSRSLNTLDFKDISPLFTGHAGNGVIARASDVLSDLAKRPLKQTPWIINIELKGVQGSGQAADCDALIKATEAAVRSSGIDPSRILFSSFSLENCLAASRAFPNAHFSFLFAENDEVLGAYTDSGTLLERSYLPFRQEFLDQVLKVWLTKAQPKTRLTFVNPEVTTISPQMINLCAQAGVGINSWGLFEKLTPERTEHYRQIASQCHDLSVPYTAITDYLPEMLRARMG